MAARQRVLAEAMQLPERLDETQKSLINLFNASRVVALIKPDVDILDS